MSACCSNLCVPPQEMAVAVRVLLFALLGLYWSSSRVEGNLKSSLASQTAFSGAVHSACAYIMLVRQCNLYKKYSYLYRVIQLTNLFARASSYIMIYSRRQYTGRFSPEAFFQLKKAKCPAYFHLLLCNCSNKTFC